MHRVEPATPRFTLNQTVDYVDHHDRVQTGTISRIDAHWDFGRAEPQLIYTISHPSYHNRRCYRSEKKIIR